MFENQQAAPAVPGSQRGGGRSADVSEPPRRRGNGAVALLCLASAAVAAALIAFLLYQPLPASLATAAAPEWIPLTEEELSDSRLVDLDLTLGDESTLRAPVTGLITGSGCTAGDKIVSGTSTFRVDKLPLVNLHTAVPLWRDLSFGDEGDDVAALQRELSRLGYLVAETERFNWETWVAWDAVAESVGGDTGYGSLELAQVLWIPEGGNAGGRVPARSRTSSRRRGAAGDASTTAHCRHRRELSRRPRSGGTQTRSRRHRHSGRWPRQALCSRAIRA